MSIFSHQSKVVLYPSARQISFYINRAQDYHLAFDANLTEGLSGEQLEALKAFLKTNSISAFDVILTDDIAVVRSFVYDAPDDSIDSAEVLSLAKTVSPFEIDPASLSFEIIKQPEKTLIRATLFHQDKFPRLKQNLENLGVAVNSILPASEVIAASIPSTPEPYFFILPESQTAHSMFLGCNGKSYLSGPYREQVSHLKKTFNYSPLYFGKAAQKLYIPDNLEVNSESVKDMEVVRYNPQDLNNQHKLPLSLPLPLTYFFVAPATPKPAIINPTMENTPLVTENRKNILPIVAVFIFTAALASIIFWFIANRNAPEAEVESPSPDASVNLEPTEAPLTTPEITPSIAEIPKTIKIQVLNATPINGQAATLKEKLTSLGFTNVAVGNSPDKLTENVVKTKAAGTEYAAYFESSLASYFPATYDTTLPTASTYDIVFYIGTDLSGSGSTTSATTPTKAAATPTVKTTTTPTKSLTPTTSALTPTKSATPTPTSSL